MSAMMSPEDLPEPRQGVSGWPWTMKSGPFRATRSLAWPKVSIVTPSYNQASYLEETIRSVLLQGYPNLEYSVIDGGSTDGSVEIIRRYERWLTFWVSEPDKGQADAINKGFDKSTGEIHGYLNSDDVLQADSLFRVAWDFANEREASVHAYPVREFDSSGHDRVCAVPVRNRPLRRTITSRQEWSDPPPEGATWVGGLLPWVVGDLYLHQPGTFWPSRAYFAAGGFDIRYHFGFDHKFFVELMSAGWPLVIHGGQPVTAFRLHEKSKTVSSQTERVNPFSRDMWRIARDLEPRLSTKERTFARRARRQTLISRLVAMKHLGMRPIELVRETAWTVVHNPDLLGSSRFWATLATMARSNVRSNL